MSDEENPAELTRERDALRAKVDALQSALSAVMLMDVRGHQLQDRLQFSPAGRAILEQVKAAIKMSPTNGA